MRLRLEVDTGISPQCLIVSGAIFALFTYPENAVAQEHIEPVLETVIVTAPITTPVEIDKSGVPVVDIPRSIQTVPRELIEEQGDTKLAETLRDVSGVTQGGQFAFGFFDRFTVRGLNTTFLNDGLPDGTSDLTGYIHTLTGVEHIEILKGPGSAIYGSTEPGGTINIVHYRPDSTPSASISEEYGGYATTTTNITLNGPINSKGLSGRIDGEYQQGDGFREMANSTGEFLGALGYQFANHNLLLRYEYHHFENRPDAVGTPFSTPSNTGHPLAVSRDTIYYTPFARAAQDLDRLFFEDSWTVNSALIVNTRALYAAHTDDIARNAGGSLTLSDGSYGLTNRQLRKQVDNSSDSDIQIEPTWRFQTGDIANTLVTGFDFRNVNSGTARHTADLPNIANVFAPVILESNMASLTFKCDATHSCDDDDLLFQSKSLYAIDQIDVTDFLKLRMSGREDWFTTSAVGRNSVPVNAGSEHPCSPPTSTQCPLVPGSPFSKSDDVFSWDVGAVYFLTPQISAFAGYSSDVYPIFNTEEPESIGQLPEKGTQIEAGLRAHFGDWLSLSSAIYQATRKDVFSTLVEPNPTGAGNLTIIAPFSYRGRGWETDVNLHPFKGWNIVGNFTAQDPVLTSFPSTPSDVGRAVPSTPKSIGNLWVSYDIPMSNSIRMVQLSLGVHSTSREYADAAQTRIIPGSTLFDAAFGLPVDSWVFRAGVSNIFDRANYQYGAGTGSGTMPGEGRTFFFKGTMAL